MWGVLPTGTEVLKPVPPPPVPAPQVPRAPAAVPTFTPRKKWLTYSNKTLRYYA